MKALEIDTKYISSLSSQNHMVLFPGDLSVVDFRVLSSTCFCFSSWNIGTVVSFPTAPALAGGSSTLILDVEIKAKFLSVQLLVL